MKKILYIGNKLEKHGYSPTSADTLPSKIKELGFSVKAVSSIKNKPVRLLHMISSLLKDARKNDLVIIDTYSTQNFWYAVVCGSICKKMQVPYVFILHGGKLEERFINSPEWVLKIFRSARVNIAPSEFLLQKLKPFFDNLRLVPNWIELKNYPNRSRNKVAPQLLWVRAFDAIYNPDLAISVLERLLLKYPEARLYMVGPDKDGSLAELKKIAEEKKLPVAFTGKLAKKDWLSLSHDCDIFINTTDVDNTPVSLIEAMALGLPVVTTEVGGIAYLIEHEKDGLLVPAGDAETMKNSIERLLQEPGLAQRLAENAREKVKKFDWEQVKELWLELLD